MPKPFISSAGLSSAKEPRLLPQKTLSSILALVAEWLVLATIVVVPLVYATQTGNGQDFIKQVALLVLVSVASLCWIGSMLVNRSLALHRTVANVVVLVVIAVTLVASLFSKSFVMGFVGGSGQEYQSFLTTILFAGLFFVIVNLPVKQRLINRAICAATFAGGLVSLLALFQFAGVKILPGVSNTSFNLIGSTVILGLYAAVTVVLAAGSFLIELPQGKWALAKRILVGFFGACALTVAVTVDFWPVWTVVILGLMAVLGFAIVRPQSIRRLGWLAVPMAVLMVAVLLFIVNIPFPIQAPTEVFPAFRQSVDVAREALVANPIIGSGPGTFAQDFALYRGIELNQSPLWYVQFDRGMSHLTTVAATMGLSGLVIWIALIIIGFWKSLAYLISTRKKDEESWTLSLVVSAAWIASATGIVIYGASLASLLLFWSLFALVIRSTSTDVAEIRFDSSPRVGLALTFGFVVLIVLVLSGWFISGSRYYADATFSKAALIDTGTKIDEVISRLEAANRMDPKSDLINRNLSQAYLIKIQQTFNDTKIEDTQRNIIVQNLTSFSVKAGIAATKLSPSSAQNWSQLGAVYEAIMSYVSNAATEARTAYTRAAELDPTSPVHPTSLGRVDLAVARMATNDLKNAKEDTDKPTLEKNIDDAIASAITNFQNALKLKPDYSAASYQLALAYDIDGKLKEAITTITRVYNANRSDLGVGYELASLYYRDNQKDKAKTLLETMVKQTPSFANGRWLLATIYEENKKFDDAIGQVEEIIKTNPENKEITTYLKKLKDAKNGVVSAPVETPEEDEE